MKCVLEEKGFGPPGGFGRYVDIGFGKRKGSSVVLHPRLGVRFDLLFWRNSAELAPTQSVKLSTAWRHPWRHIRLSRGGAEDYYGESLASEARCVVKRFLRMYTDTR